VNLPPDAGFLDEQGSPKSHQPAPETTTPPVIEAGFLEGGTFEAIEDEPSLDLDSATIPTKQKPIRSFLYATVGLLILLGGYVLLSFISFIVSMFDQHFILGGIGLAVLVVGVGLIGRAVLIELRGMASLTSVTSLRAILADPRAPIEQSRAAALTWARAVALEVEEVSRALPEIGGATTRDQLVGILRSAVMPWITPRVAAVGRRQAGLSFVGAAASPAPALDALIVLWRGVVVIREVAALHGVRPGAAGMLKLLADTSLSAAATAAADAVASAVAQQFVTGAVAAKLGREAAGASMAALRILRLSQVAAVACSPLPRE